MLKLNIKSQSELVGLIHLHPLVLLLLEVLLDQVQGPLVHPHVPVQLEHVQPLNAALLHKFILESLAQPEDVVQGLQKNN